MTTSLASEIRHNVARVVAGDLTVRQFEEWFVPATWDVEQTADSETVRLAHEILHRVVEYDSGLWDDAEFHAKVCSLISAGAIGRDGVAASS